MATALNLGAKSAPIKYINGLRFAIVSAEWNEDITNALTEGAKNTFMGAGYQEKDVDIFHVPGTVELTFAAAQLVKSKKYDAVIIIGCVIRGDTTHYDYVCQSVTQGMTQLNENQNIPVIFGVLTVENLQQALDRAGGKLGNKGAECAECAIKMCDFILQIKK